MDEYQPPDAWTRTSPDAMVEINGNRMVYAPAE